MKTNSLEKMTGKATGVVLSLVIRFNVSNYLFHTTKEVIPLEKEID